MDLHLCSFNRLIEVNVCKIHDWLLQCAALRNKCTGIVDSFLESFPVVFFSFWQNSACSESASEQAQYGL